MKLNLKKLKLKLVEFKSPKDKRAYMEAWIEYIESRRFHKPTIQVFVNVTQENLDGYRNNVSHPNVFSNCPLGRSLQDLFGKHVCIAGGKQIKLIPYSSVPSNTIANFPEDIATKSQTNCNNGNDKPFSFYIDMPREWVKECNY